MIVRARVTPNARRESFIELGDKLFHISVKEDREQGAANARVLELIAEHYGVPRKALRLIRGAKNPTKVIEIMGL